MDRTDFAAELARRRADAGFSLASAADDTAAARRLVDERLAAPMPQTVEIASGRRVGTALVDTVARRVAQLRKADDYLGGRDLWPLIERELRATAGIVRDAAYPDPLGRGLLTAVAELCQLAGWVAVDAGAPARAARCHLLGVHAAHAAGDRACAANLVSTLSYQVANEGDPRESIELATAAASAGPHVSAATRALLGERVAWAHAKAGEVREAERALVEVERAFERRAPGDDPEWTYWLNEDEILVMAGRCYVELGWPRRAIPLLEGVLGRYDERMAREAALYTSWLAEAYLDAGEVDQAAALAARVRELTGSTSSARGDGRLALLRGRLEPYAEVGAVRDFLAVEG